jgi:hypothetical protein
MKFPCYQKIPEDGIFPELQNQKECIAKDQYPEGDNEYVFKRLKYGS